MLIQAGTILWSKNYGGSGNEEATQIIKTLDNNLMFCALSASNDMDLTGNYGSNDLWLAKISISLPTKINANSTWDEITIYPNPTTSKFTIKAQNGNINNVQIFNISGKKIINTNKSEINISKYSKGIYILKIRKDNSIITRKLILK